MRGRASDDQSAVVDGLWRQGHGEGAQQCRICAAPVAEVLATVENLEKDRDELLAFYDFPAIHWIHLRTTNPIESTFATVRLRTKRSRSCGNRDTTLSMVFKLLQSAQKRWKRIKGFDQLKLVVDNVQFQDGIEVEDQSDRNAA